MVLNIILTMATIVPERWIKCIQQIYKDSYSGAKSYSLNTQELVPIKDFAYLVGKVPNLD